MPPPPQIGGMPAAAPETVLAAQTEPIALSLDRSARSELSRKNGTRLVTDHLARDLWRKERAVGRRAGVGHLTPTNRSVLMAEFFEDVHDRRAIGFVTA